jgi:hypothetical protein
MNLKELTEEDKEKLKRHEIELSDENNKIVWIKTFEKQFNIKTKLETLDRYVRSILNKFDPDDEIEVDIQEFDGKKIVNVKILDRVLH